MKPSIIIRYIRKVAKILSISTSGLEIEAKEEDYTTTNAKSIILLF